MAGPKVQGELSMDGSKFFGVLGQANAAVGRFGNNVTSSIGGRLAAAFSVGAMGMAIRKTMEYADSIEEMSQRIGVGTDKLQEWTFAAKQSGADTEKLVGFVEALTRAASDAKNLDAFAKMGINPNGMTPEALFGQVASFSKGKGAPEIQAALQSLGVDFRKIGPMVAMLSSDLDEAGKSARGLGAVIDQATIHNLANLNDQLSIVGQILMGQFAPALLMAGVAALDSIVLWKQVQEGIAETMGSEFVRMEVEGNGYDKLQASRMDAYKKQLEAKGLSKAEIEKELQKFGLATTDTGSVAGDVFAKADAIRAKSDELIAKLINYKPQEPGTITTEPEKEKRRKIASSDSLLNVGNFLGSARSKLETLAERQIGLLQTIARNTTPVANGGTSGFPV